MHYPSRRETPTSERYCPYCSSTALGGIAMPAPALPPENPHTGVPGQHGRPSPSPNESGPSAFEAENAWRTSPPDAYESNPAGTSLPGTEEATRSAQATETSLASPVLSPSPSSSPEAQAARPAGALPPWPTCARFGENPNKLLKTYLGRDMFAPYQREEFYLLCGRSDPDGFGFLHSLTGLKMEPLTELSLKPWQI